MRVVLFLAIAVGFCPYARADVRCEQAYQDMKRFETEHPVDSEEAMVALRKGEHCSELVLDFEDRVDANAQALAVYAKAFVAACRDEPTKAGDVAFYGLDAVLNPHRSTLRERCNSKK